MTDTELFTYIRNELVVLSTCGYEPEDEEFDSSAAVILAFVRSYIAQRYGAVTPAEETQR